MDVVSRGLVADARIAFLLVFRYQVTPTDETIASDSGCSGQCSMVWFHRLSGGKTSSAEQMASASGVSNITGLVIGGTGKLTLTSDKTVEIVVEHFQIDGYAVLDFSLLRQPETTPAN